MNLLDVGFVLGALAPPTIVPLELVVIVACRPGRTTLWLVTGTALLTALAWLTYWYLWGIAFDYVDTGRPYATAVEYGLNASVTLSAICCLTLGFVAIRHLLRRLSARFTQTLDRAASQ